MKNRENRTPPDPVCIWHPFDRISYAWEWHRKKLWGVIREFGRDIRYSRQRARKGYCDADLWAIDDWFLDIMPRMLQEFKETSYGFPDTVMPGMDLASEADNAEARRRWDETLDRMIFLLREANEPSTLNNPVQEEYDRAMEEFEAKYGHLGQKLWTAEDKESANNNEGIRVYTMANVEEYRPIHDRYMAEEKKRDAYREQCKNEALAMFSKWFYSLWD